MLACVAVLASCSDPPADPGPDAGLAPALPRGSWRSGSWTCESGCGATPALATAPWLEISGDVVRWYSAEGAVVIEDQGAAQDGLCWTVPPTAAHGAMSVCGALCADEQCARVEAVAIGAQSWSFVATR